VLLPVKNGKPLGRIKTVTLPSGKVLDAEAGLGTKAVAPDDSSNSGGYSK
jgi:hypothetical protein